MRLIKTNELFKINKVDEEISNAMKRRLKIMTDNKFYCNEFFKKFGKIVKIEKQTIVGTCDCCFEKIMHLQLVKTKSREVHFICDYCRKEAVK